MTAPENKRSIGVGVAVLEYLDKHSNQTIYLKDLSEAVGFPDTVVQGSISNLRYKNVADAKDRLQIVLKGRAWLWRTGNLDSRTADAKLDELYVMAYQSKSGETIVEGEDGTLYKLVRI